MTLMLLLLTLFLAIESLSVLIAHRRRARALTPTRIPATGPRRP